MEKQHIGTLTGSPITDIKITLKSGAAHIKHTEGGDFRQATYRAVRQGLMQAKSVLLEPYYSFVIDIPSENVGKVMTDLNMMGAEFSVYRTGVEVSKINGTAPAGQILNYQRQLTAYTHGAGHISYRFDGYGPCKNSDEVIESMGYSPENDTENTPDSVFCSHGAGFHVKWNEVSEYMHLESIIKPKKTEEKKSVVRSASVSANDEELLRIFERIYGKVKTKLPDRAMYTPKEVKPGQGKKHGVKKYDKSYLLIDGYNMIFAWDSLKKIAKDSLEDARRELIERLSVYKVFKDDEIIIVFDAYKVKGNRGEEEREKGLTIVYTKEAQTADAYIEKTAKELTKEYNVTVATSNALEQLIIFGSGAFRLPARMLEEDVINVENSVRKMVEVYNLRTENSGFLRALEEKLSQLKNEENEL
jgi:predicted RNA-binding protein with PIN domain